ncbi:MAG: MBL fold metallo-hydrolase [Candidatus Omnitrophica bacterium]|nr:MBL fold metallo-hydrolase [Candidatus Omnitrophota bacterium]
MVEVKAFVGGLLETNCYLVYSTDSNVGFLIDPGFFSRKIAGEIQKNDIIVRNIINTHGHIDHTAGNRNFGYPVLIHEDDNEFLKNPSKNLSFFVNILSNSPPADRLLKDKDIIEERDIRFEVIHTPGHTPGSISLRMGNRVFTGDALFRESVGRTDFPYGNEAKLLDSIQSRLMTLPDETEILPGHGPSSTIGWERGNNPFLRNI